MSLKTLPERIASLFGWQSGATIDLTADDLAEAGYAVDELERFGFRVRAIGRAIHAEHVTRSEGISFAAPTARPDYVTFPMDLRAPAWDPQFSFDRAVLAVQALFYPCLAVLWSRGAVLEAPQ